MDMLQLDFFQDDDLLRVNDRMEKLEESCSKVRKSQFAKIGDLNKRITSIEERMDILERNICQKNDVTADDSVTSNKLYGEKDCHKK